MRYESSWNGYEHNVFFLNRDRKEYLSVAFLLGLSFEADCRAVVSDDLDGDGLLDLLVTTHYGTFSERHALYVMQNRLQHARNWIGVHLAGRSSIGAQVTLHMQYGRRTAQVINGDSFCSQHAATVHFGLGDERRVRRIEIRWPSSRLTSLEDPEVNRYHFARPE